MTIDELERYGVEHMADDEVETFLSTRDVGVLGLEADDGPYLLPMSYGYDGESSLYFAFITGSSSRKTQLTGAERPAKFLVYDATSMFVWESVVLSGTVDDVPDAERDGLDTVLEDVQHPDALETAGDLEGVEIYEFQVGERTGIKQVGLPPGFTDRRGGVDPE